MLALLATQPAHARAHHSDAWAREYFAAAGRMREALNGRLLQIDAPRLPARGECLPLGLSGRTHFHKG